MRRVAVVLVVAAACTVPEYEFAKDAGGPEIPARDAAPGDDDDVRTPPVEAGGDVVAPVDAAPLPNTAMPSTADFNADCTGFTLADTGAAVIQDADASNHCVIFLHNASYGRSWAAARLTCATITRGAKQARLAIFPNAAKATNMVAKNTVFPGTLAAWIGLELTGEPATDMTKWTWLGGATTAAFDGWVAGHPAGQRCASWAGAASAQWIDVDCALSKGFLCEMDE